MKEILGFSNNVEFLIIPGSNSKSKKNELLITNEKGPGVIHFTPSGTEFTNENKNKIEGLSIIVKDKTEIYNLNQTENKEENNIEVENSLGNIVSLAISPSKNQIALLNSEGSVFFFHSTLDLDLSKFPRMKVKYNSSFSRIKNQNLSVPVLQSSF